MQVVTWALDLDGVVWLGDEPIPGAAEAVARLRERGERVVFLTNNSYLAVDDYVDKLRRMKIPAEASDVRTSAQAAAALLDPGMTALLCAGPGAAAALHQRGVHVVTEGRADAVIVGWHVEFDYDRLTAATRAVLAGARLIGTNDDPTYPTPEGPLPGGGSLLAAVAYAAGATAEVAGKPHDPTVALLRETVGAIDVVVGDRPSTDGRLARRLGARFALVLSGVTSHDPGGDAGADVVAADLASVVSSASW